MLRKKFAQGEINNAAANRHFILPRIREETVQGWRGMCLNFFNDKQDVTILS